MISPPERQMSTAQFKQRLSQDNALLGLWTSTDSPVVAEILANAGADWLLIDMEHSGADVASITAQLQAANGAPTSLVVRPPSHDPVMLKRLLDAGVVNLLVPFVDSAEQAKAIVKATRYPPEGSRGVATGHRGARYGRDKAYLAEANQRICLMVQIETAHAAAQAQSIAAVDGVDGVFIGPADLSASLGRIGQANHPDVRTTIKGVVDVVSAVGKPLGTFSATPEDARDKADQGFKFVVVTTDVRLLVQGADNALARARGEA